MNPYKNSHKHEVLILEIHTQFVKESNNIELYKVFAIYNSDKNFFNKRNWIAISFNDYIKLTIIYIKMKLSIKLRSEIYRRNRKSNM